MISRQEAQQLMEKYIANPSLRRHCQMVAQAMEAYANNLNQDTDSWYIAGLLHDLDWEQFPDEHPNKAVNDILPQADVPAEIIAAITAHAPDRTGQQPDTQIERYLFACDEICGFLDAVAKVRPAKFAGMKWSSVNKKLKNKSFAANVSRDDIEQGAQLIDKPLAEHVGFLIEVFNR